MRILTTVLLVALACCVAAYASLEDAKELLEEAREELEAVIIAAESTPAERAEALALLRQIEGGRAASAAEPAPITGKIVDNGDGTGSDPVTGLMWVLKDNGAESDFEGAKSNCAGSRRGGHTDWRLPTWVDISSLILPARERQDEFRASPLFQLSSCAPWVIRDDLENMSAMERDLCDGGGMVVNRHKRGPALCVRGAPVP